ETPKKKKTKDVSSSAIDITSISTHDPNVEGTPIPPPYTPTSRIQNFQDQNLPEKSSSSSSSIEEKQPTNEEHLKQLAKAFVIDHIGILLQGDPSKEQLKEVIDLLSQELAKQRKETVVLKDLPKKKTISSRKSRTVSSDSSKLDEFTYDSQYKASLRKGKEKRRTI